MGRIFVAITALILVQTALSLDLVHGQAKEETAENKHDSAKAEGFKREQQASKGSVTIGGKTIPYDAFAGTVVVHPKGWDDVPQNAEKGEKNVPTEASMFYVAYFKSGDPAAQRPVTFLFNGGPGSSTVWLHVGAFGPRRVVTSDNSHTPAAPYPIVNNEYSLLDASDLVFVDDPGTGFSRIAGKDREKSFYGVDASMRSRSAPDLHSRLNSGRQLWQSCVATLGCPPTTLINRTCASMRDNSKRRSRVTATRPPAGSTRVFRDRHSTH